MWGVTAREDQESVREMTKEGPDATERLEGRKNHHSHWTWELEVTGDLEKVLSTARWRQSPKFRNTQHSPGRMSHFLFAFSFMGKKLKSSKDVQCT